VLGRPQAEPERVGLDLPAGVLGAQPGEQLGRRLGRRLAGDHSEPPAPPSILVLSQTYELAQATVKKALAILKDERLIETTPGYGTFVRDRGQDS